MGRMISRRLICLGFVVAMAASAFTVPAYANKSEPQQFLRSLVDDAVLVLSDRSLDDTGRAKAFRNLLRQGFDMPAIGKFVLGRYWRKANPVEKGEFIPLFEDYVVAIYGRRLSDHSGEALKITGQRPDGLWHVIVNSKFAQANGPSIKVDWRLKERAGKWRVVDIMVEGVSMALAQRSEFATVIRSSGGKVSGLLDKLRKKTQQLALYNRQTAATKATISTE